jgi:hypothetical protein
MSIEMMLRGVFRVLRRVKVMGVSQVRMVSSRLVVPVKVVLGGFVVVACSVLMMLRCLGVMVGCLAGHGRLLSLRVGIGYSTRIELFENARGKEITAEQNWDEIPCCRGQKPGRFQARCGPGQHFAFSGPLAHKGA